MKLQLAKPVCFLMHGIPGSGKSAFARQFSEVLGMAHVNSDRIRAELYDDAQFGGAENSTVWRLSSYMAETLLSCRQSLVFDMHLPTQTLRKTLKDMTSQHGTSFVIIWVQTDYETALYRATHRDRRRLDDRHSFEMSPQLHERLARQGTNPNHEPTLVISGKHLFKTQLTPVLRKLSQLNLININSPAGDKVARFDHERRIASRQ